MEPLQNVTEVLRNGTEPLQNITKALQDVTERYEALLITKMWAWLKWVCQNRK